MGTCRIHGSPFTHREGVSSKTGKPYSFWSCPEKNADGSFCTEKPAPNAIPAESMAVKPVNGNGAVKDSWRIERQHSQEMAIRELELLFKVAPKLVAGEKLRLAIKEGTDHFHRDLEKPKPEPSMPEFTEEDLADFSDE